MRISDWSSDVCSSDLRRFDQHIGEDGNRTAPFHHRLHVAQALEQRCAFDCRLHSLFPLLFWQDRQQRAAAKMTGFFSFITTYDERHKSAAPAFGEERSEEHTSELQSLMRISYAVFCLKKKKNHITNNSK